METGKPSTGFQNVLRNPSGQRRFVVILGFSLLSFLMYRTFVTGLYMEKHVEEVGVPNSQMVRRMDRIRQKMRDREAREQKEQEEGADENQVPE
ncbi:MAG: hypothetical protein MHM6MM_002400 [Cercozoa sp. M6MM]